MPVEPRDKLWVTNGPAPALLPEEPPLPGWEVISLSHVEGAETHPGSPPERLAAGSLVVDGQDLAVS